MLEYYMIKKYKLFIMAKNIVSLNINNNDYSLRPYAICSTAGATQTKNVDIADFNLFEGATILVKFTYTNSHSNPTLNINDKGAVTLICNKQLIANNIYEFIYDGTNWVHITDFDNSTITTISDSTNKQKIALNIVNEGWQVDMSTAIDFFTGNNKKDGIIKIPTARIEDKMNGAGTSGGNLIFYTQAKSTTNTNPNKSGLVERLKIDDSGNIIATGTFNAVTITENNVALSDKYILRSEIGNLGNNGSQMTVEGNTNTSYTGVLKPNTIIDFTKDITGTIAITGFNGITDDLDTLTTYGLIFKSTGNAKLTWPSNTTIYWVNGEYPDAVMPGTGLSSAIYEIIITYAPKSKRFTATYAKYK